MAVIQDAQVDQHAAQAAYHTSGVPGVEDFIKATLAREAWRWYRDNEGRKYRVRVLFFRWSVKVKNVRWIFVILFGPDPLGDPNEEVPAPE